MGKEKTLKENRAFEEMRKATVEKLQHKSPLEIAQKAGIVYDVETKQFRVNTLGNTFLISYPEYRFTPELEGWHHLLILHYLDMADGTELTGELTNLGSLKDGLIRGTKFEQNMECELSRIFRGRTREDIWVMFEKLGAEERTGKADLCVEIPFLPNYPVIFNIWLEDDEFPPSAKLLVDKRADHYLTIEDAVTLGEVLLNTIRETIKKGTIS